MTDYNVNFTDANMNPITAPEDTVNRDSLDVTLFGRMFQNYGEEVNEDLLNILENFACPESELVTDEISAYPDTSQTSKTQLQNPVDGQFWYNSTRQSIYFYDGTKWVPVPKRGTYAANWGQVMHGQQLPKPVNQHGKVFDYDECIWSVSPASINGTIDSLNCNTDAIANVTMQYRYANTQGFTNGIANYLIVGIIGNMNSGIILPPIQPSPTPTPSMSATPASTMTPTPSVTPTLTAYPTPTPTPTLSTTPTPTSGPTSTPAVSQTSTPVPSVTPTSAPITYCYQLQQICLGYGGVDSTYGPLVKNNVTMEPIINACSTNNPHSGRGYTPRGASNGNVNMSNTYPKVRIVVTVNDSIGNTSGPQELFFKMTHSVSLTDHSDTLYHDVIVGGVTKQIVVNAVWHKHDGNSNNAEGTLTATVSLPSGGRC